LPHIKFFALLFLFPLFASSESLDQLIEARLEKNRKTYEYLHMHPEVSGEEVETSKLVARELTELGYQVTANVGGFGVVAILKNGAGPTALIRADMDALSVQEQTGLPYASVYPGKMHACGHDLHTTILLGAAQVFKASLDQWKGTLVLVFQPSEENGKGAMAMINDGLFTRFPKPDYAMALHVMGRGKKGQLYYRSGFANAASDAFDATFYGKGTHAANPHTGINPIGLFVNFYQALNSLIAEETSPVDIAVGSIAKVQAGTAYNAIPDSASFSGTIRYYLPEVGAKIRARMDEKIKFLAADRKAPEPKLEFYNHVDPVFNDPVLNKKLVQLYEQEFGKDVVVENTQGTGFEDFAFYARGGFPTVFFNIGTSEKIPADFINHSQKFAPPFEGTYQMGIKTFVKAVLHLQPAP
jgi:amidohydrolase